MLEPILVFVATYVAIGLFMWLRTLFRATVLYAVKEWDVEQNLARSYLLHFLWACLTRWPVLELNRAALMRKRDEQD